MSGITTEKSVYSKSERIIQKLSNDDLEKAEHIIALTKLTNFTENLSDYEMT